MADSVNINQQRLAEKLIILNDRGVGMLTRIYNIKKASCSPSAKPKFLLEQTLESPIKDILANFPNINTNSLQAITNIRYEILNSLSLYYYSLVDVMDFKENVCDLLNTMDAYAISLDISLNFELTKNYLDLVVTYMSILILLSRIEDLKSMLGLFNAAHELAHNETEPSFPRLAQMIIDYDLPLKKLTEEFEIHHKVLSGALSSLCHVYPARNSTAAQWRSEEKLSLANNLDQLLKPFETDTMSCEYISLETLERWVIFGLVICHHLLQQDHVNEMWVSALESCWVVVLFRDEVIYIHLYFQDFFNSLTGYDKSIAKLKDCYRHAVQFASTKHQERRMFLRNALKELGLLFADQPGLLGPKALLVFVSLCYARDEVFWLLRHNDNPPQKLKGYVRAAKNEVDRQLPELLFLIEELRALIGKYSQVIQRYYVQFLTGYDAKELKIIIGTLNDCSEYESIILSSMFNTIATLNVKHVENKEKLDFQALRLDWFRLQVFASINETPLALGKQRQLAQFIDKMVYHTRMIDNIEDILLETSDLSLFCFYTVIFKVNFRLCLELPAQYKYSIAFPLICRHFQSSIHKLCPEESHEVRERSLTFANRFLEELTKEAKDIIMTTCKEQCIMSDRLLPKHCLQNISHFVSKKKKGKEKKNAIKIDQPGAESYRKLREEMTTMDKLHMALTEICYAINYCTTIKVWGYTFAPRMYLRKHLETRFAKSLAGMVMYNENTREIAKPSELLVSVKTYMSVLQSVESYVDIDIARVFEGTLLEQTQPMDSQGNFTIATSYINWYSKFLLMTVFESNICFSMNKKAFISLNGKDMGDEGFSEINELRNLSELIGPYGMKLLNDSLAWQIAYKVQELKKFVLENKDVLQILRTDFSKAETVREQFKRLHSVNRVLTRMVSIGVILSFRQIAQESLLDVLEQRIPFLITSVKDFQHQLPTGKPMWLVSELPAAAGLHCDVDPILVRTLQEHIDKPEDQEHLVVCLLMVFVAVSIPKLAQNKASFYWSSIGGHSNNIHCLALSINYIFGALFLNCGQGDIEERMKEFLIIAASCILHLSQETDKKAIKNRDSIYVLLDLIVQESPFLTIDLLKSYFPYALIRNAYREVYKQEMLLPHLQPKW